MFGNYFILTIICFLTILTILSLVSGWELSEIGDNFLVFSEYNSFWIKNCRFYADVPKLWST